MNCGRKLYVQSGVIFREHVLTIGFLAHFEPKERHEVSATEDSRLVLLLSPWPGEGHPSRR